MSNQYVDTEVEKIINDNEFSDPLNFAMAGAWVLGNLKGINLKSWMFLKQALSPIILF